MNIFQDLEGIFAPQKTEQGGSIMDLLQFVTEIRAKLDSQGYLIERYLSSIFEVFGVTSTYQATEAGYEESYNLMALCFSTMESRSWSQASDDKKELVTHLFYPVVNKHFEEHPDTLLLRFAVVNRHFAMLSQEFLQFAFFRFVKEEKGKIYNVVDCVSLNEFYTEIPAIVVEPLIERLNHILEKQLLAVPDSIGFAYGHSCALLDNLAYMDNETVRQIFQLLMDECAQIWRSPDGV